jgi:hypothetical protein
VVSMTLKNWEKADRENCLLNKSELEPHRLRLRTPREQCDQNGRKTTFIQLFITNIYQKLL